MHWGQLVAHDITHVPTFRTCKLINSFSLFLMSKANLFSVVKSDQFGDSMLHGWRQVLVTWANSVSPPNPLCFPIDVDHDNEF
jgi:hypothetical protein